LKSYWHIFSIGIQNTLVYRVNFFFRALFNLVPLLATISLWRAIYTDPDHIVAGYTLAQMLSYYVIVTVVDALTAVTEDEWQIASDIKDGHISQFLVKPVNYLHYRLCLFFSGRCVYTLAAIGPVAIFIAMMGVWPLPPADGLTVVCFLVSMMMTALLQFLLSYITAMLAFWVVEISTFVFILLAFERVASGQMFPLDVLPSWLAQTLLYTPFPYQMYFPVSIYMGKTTGLALVNGLIIQACWVMAGYALARLIWKRGLKTYTAVGG
jgi:ABC-2 type transport system permease protein